MRVLRRHHRPGLHLRPFPSLTLRPRLFIVVACLATSLACSEDTLTARRVPGTERVDPNDSRAWFTISPDDKWMAFMEIDSTYPMSLLGDSVPTFHLVTMHLVTLEKSHHSIEQFPQSVFRETNRPWQEVQYLFDVASWKDGKLILQCSWRRSEPWMSVTPGIAPVSVSEPETERSCSDCAPTRLYERAARRIPWTEASHGGMSIALNHADRSSSVYTMGRERRNTVIKVDSSGHHETIARVRRPGSRCFVFRVRVSPDERYIAFAVEELPLVTIPFSGHCRVFLVDARTRRKARVVDDYDYVSKILWTSDSQRFYFGAAGQEHGIYFVDVADLDWSARGELQ